jgi:hypothetical protein
MAVVVSEGLWGQPAKEARRGSPRSGRPAAGASPAARLEREAYNRTENEPHVVFHDCRCNTRICPKCGPRKGHHTRDRMLTKAEAFVAPLLLTLTVNRDNFPDPESAHRRVAQDGLIRRLMDRLDVRIWIWVLEFQGRTGTGWPHWHVLLDASTLPRKRIDLAQAWHLWRDTWAVGGLDVRGTSKFRSPRHAILYVTKYLTKFPKTGFPVWVLEAEHRIRFFQPCRRLGPLAAPESTADADAQDSPADAPPASDDSAPDVPGRDAEGPPRRRRCMRPLIARAAECGTASNAVLVTPDGEGSTVREWLGTTPANASRIAYLARTHQLRTDLDVVRTVREFPGTTLIENRPIVFAKGSTPPRQVFKQLREEFETGGELQHHQTLIADRRARLTDRNVFAQREAEEATPRTPGRDAEGGEP